MKGKLKIALAALLGTVMVGAASAATTEISLAYPVAVTAPIAKIMTGYADAFMAAHPDVSVKLVFSGGYNDVKTAIQTAIQGKAEAPELAIMLATDVQDLVDAEYVQSFEPLMKTASDKAFITDFAPAYLGNSRVGGKLYGIPFQRSAVVLYYNADLFEAAKIAPPANWSDWASAAKALTVDGGKTRWGIEFPSDGPYWLFQPLAIGNGRNIFTDEVTVNFNDPKVIEAAQFYIDLSKKYGAMPAGVQANWGASTQDFIAGKTAMVVHTSGSLANILAGAKFKVGVSVVPGKTSGKGASVTGGGNMYLTAGHSAAEIQAAWDFVKFITEPSRVVDFSMKTGYVPYRQSALQSAEWKAYTAKTPQASAVADVIPLMGAEISTHSLSAVKDSFNKALQTAFNGQATPKDALDAAQRDADKILKDYR